MQVLVVVKDRFRTSDGIRNSSTLQVIVDIDPNGTVQEVIDGLAKKTGASRCCFQLILCGKVLEHTTTIGSLLLGPSTSLTALVIDAVEGPEEFEKQSAKESDLNRPASFQVFCKFCAEVKQGKLRVYCSICNSSSLLIRRDPEGWSDVLSSSRIYGDCQECGAPAFAQFRFKCVTCGEIAMPLVHCRGARSKESDCCVCGERITDITVDLGCHHFICIQCFIAYMATSFNQQHFILKPPFGYTLSCPIYNCEACIADPHHFYLLGLEKYEAYKQLAAEKFVTLEDEGIFCPNPSCGAAFMSEHDPDQPKVRCPECRCVFCRECRLRNCVCEEGDATRTTIQTTCKNCPICDAPTERNGGCTHMHCIHCNAHWCFLCVKPWSEECQWNHWFD